MHPASICAPEARQARQGDKATLAAALKSSRADTLATFATLEQQLPGLAVPRRPELNPPLWELGHIGWFQDWWTARNPQCALGLACDPEAPRRSADPPGADALYDSSRVPHASRWSLPLPDADATRAHLAGQLERCLALLGTAEDSDAGLYCFRLALLHEDMHHEAALYMAQGLGLRIEDPRWQPRPLPSPPEPLAFEPGHWRLGSPADAGFAFDNEWPAQDRAAPACRIDAQVLRWAELLPFVEAGGYGQRQWWDAAGLEWLQRTGLQAPRDLRRSATGWQQRQWDRWLPLDPARPACHLSLHEALAWCRWAGRRLPTELEWERAAISRPEAFRWGDVWEWTASSFEPFPGFQPHPYREYSAPWFDGRPVLKGASCFTQPRMRHPRYRNFFASGRHDVPAGFRSCAL